MSILPGLNSVILLQSTPSSPPPPTHTPLPSHLPTSTVHPLPHRHPASTPAPAASPAIPGEGSTAATDSAKITRGKDPVATADVSGKGGTSVGDKPQAAGAVGVGGATATPVQDKGAGAAVELDKPWIVGRVLDEVDRRLGAKQEKIRELFGGGEECWCW